MSNENWVPIKLPSKCLTYHLENPDEVYLRPLKGKDEKLISEISGLNFEKKFLLLLKNILKGVDPKKLTLGDRLFIAIWEALNSYSDKVVLKCECENCWEKFDFTVDLGKLEVVELPSDYKEPYEVKLPVTGKTIKLRLLTVEDNLKIEEMANVNQNTWLYRYALSVVDLEKNVFDIVNFLEELPAKDVAIIRAFHEKFFHGPKLETKYICPNCGGDGIMPVPFRIEFLFPYGKDLVRNFGNTI